MIFTDELVPLQFPHPLLHGVEKNLVSGLQSQQKSQYKTILWGMEIIVPRQVQGSHSPAEGAALRSRESPPRDLINPFPKKVSEKC